jgi:hypothetical protein
MRLFIILATFASVALAQPTFEIVGGLEHNLGKIPLHDLYDTLTVRNSGTRALRIVAINPTCGCTAAAIDSNLVPAGGTARVFVKIEPPDALGVTRKTIEFLTNDLTRPSTMFAYRFEVLREIGYRPTSFAFAECQVNEPCRQSVTLFNFSDIPQSIIRLPFTVDGLKSMMPDSVTIPAHDSLSYTLEWTARDAGLQHGRIALRTTSTVNPHLELNIIANVKDEKGNVLMPGRAR